MDRKFGRLKAADIRDTAFSLRALIPNTVPDISKYWRTGPILDQGDTPECVAYGWKQWLDSAPLVDNPSLPPDPQEIYDAAQQLDDWAGTPHDGTTVRAGAQVMTNLHRIGAYHWSTSPEDVRAYLVTTGTVVLGIDWYDGMFNPDAHGFVRPTGSIAGGHCVLAVGYSKILGAFRCVNSWGLGWSQRGRFWILGEDLATLLADQGEACAGVEVKP